MSVVSEDRCDLKSGRAVGGSQIGRESRLEMAVRAPGGANQQKFWTTCTRCFWCNFSKTPFWIRPQQKI